MLTPPLPHRVVLLATLAVTTLAACKKSGPPQAFPPAEVTVAIATPHNVETRPEFVGSAEASRSVQVRSQVTGVITARPYVEGSFVEQGAVLFRIDSVPYAAAYQSARASLADAEARFNNAQRNVERLRPLLADNAVARRDVDDADAELARARAAVDAAHGAVDRTKKDLDDTTVRAQLSGRAGRANFVEGARVTGSADLLTTIDAIDPAYVTFRPSVQQQMVWRSDPAVRAAVVPGGAARVRVTLPDGTTLPRTGKIDFVDPVVDPATGTQALRATFSNADRLLVPGQFVRVTLEGIVRTGAITIPQRAIQQTLNRQFVWVVDGDSVISRDITTGDIQAGQVLVEQGLSAGDKVIVDGIQKVGPGRKVHATPLPDSATAAVPTGAAR